MKEIKTKAGYTIFVDNEDYDFLNQWKWQVLKCNKGVLYARRNQNRVKNGIKIRKTILMHRAVLGIIANDIKCDHIDHNGLNNQKQNLRQCNIRQNNCNRRKRDNCSSKYLGVIKKTNKKRIGDKLHIYHGWGSALGVNGKIICLGFFKTEIEAAIAYDNAAKKHHGEFANLNFKDTNREEETPLGIQQDSLGELEEE